MGKLLKGILITCSTIIHSGVANATIITYEVANISGNTWEYAYTVENNTLGFDIEEFSIFFDPALYENISLATAPADWDPLVVPPNPHIPDDGFYDALSWASGIAPGDVLGGFSVQFDYLGADAPGVQFFQIVDPLTFDVPDSGTTQVADDQVSVPEPSTLPLLVIGLAGFFGTFRKAKA